MQIYLAEQIGNFVRGIIKREYFALVRAGDLEVERAAERLGLTPEQFVGDYELWKTFGDCLREEKRRVGGKTEG